LAKRRPDLLQLKGSVEPINDLEEIKEEELEEVTPANPKKNQP
jgi:hypothetical protein